MKKTRMWGLLLLTAGFTAFALFGCGSDKAAKKETKTEAEATETPQESDEQTDTDTSQDGLKDTDPAPANEEVEQTDPADIGGEGTTDDTMPDLTGVTKAPLGEPCVVEGESGAEFCTLTINSIKTTDERNEDDPENPEQVVVVDYTYENTTSDEPLLLDDMSFKLLEGDTVCRPYYLSTLTPAEPAETGKTANGQIAFSVSKKCKKVILFFENESSGAAAVFESKL